MGGMTDNRKRFLEFFAPCLDPKLSFAEMWKLLSEKQKEFNALTGSSDLFMIAVSGNIFGKTKEERIKALNEYLEITGSDGTEQHIIELRNIILGTVED